MTWYFFKFDIIYIDNTIKMNISSALFSPSVKFI